jgi:hypothetical protein
VDDQISFVLELYDAAAEKKESEMEEGEEKVRAWLCISSSFLL